uniref:Uncharacterized protein LOC114327966 isoform X1 n=1 Tax=Diabrotica virgifera virgifera TaxID=50390 RepID=A0A6P7FH76_DIAVI
MYLSSKQLVDEFMQKHGQIKIENNIVQARRLISPAERIVLSNVCPSIPHSLLTDYLQKIGLNLLSPVTFLKISSNLPEYNHILSFRRQIYVSPHNISLPDSFLLDFDNTTYRIFLETMACYTCKKAGHIATNCPDKMESLANSNNSQPISSPLSETMPQPTATILSHEQIPIEESSANNLNNPNIEESQEDSTMDTSIAINVDLQSKRSISEVLTSPETSHTEKPFTVPTSKPKAKKIKSDEEHVTSKSSKSYDLEPVKNFIQNRSTPFVLNYDQLNLLISNITGAKNPIDIIIQDFTPDLMQLHDMLTEVYTQLKNRSFKRFITTLRKKILRHLGNELSESESESSQVSQ